MPELTWTEPPEPYNLANGDEWWHQHGKAGVVNAAAHGRRSDGQHVFKVIALAKTASAELKEQALARAIAELEINGLLFNAPTVPEGGVMPKPESYKGD